MSSKAPPRSRTPTPSSRAASNFDVLNFDVLLGARGLLEGGAELLGLLLKRRELALGEFALERQNFLHVLGLHQLGGEFESRLDIGLGVAQRGQSDILGAGGDRHSGGVDGGDGLLRGAGKALESLARLLDALFGEFANFGRNLIGRAGHWNFLP